jgi:hypothetical protein
MPEDDPKFVLRALQQIAEEEDDAILSALTQVDSLFSKAGRLNSPGWRAERQKTIVAGVKHAGDRMKAEARQLGAADARNLSEEVGAFVARLSNSLVEKHRQIQMHGKVAAIPTEVEQSCQALVEALHKVQTDVMDDLKYRLISSPAASAPTVHIGNLTAGGHIAIGAGDVSQVVHGFDVGALFSLLAEVKRIVEQAQLGGDQHELVRDSVATIEVLAQQPKADAGLVARTVKRLAGVLKDVGVPVASGVVEAYIKTHMGLP